ncbi:hypothetical protein FB446DRAFT_760640 [Lentinula raphanica]|nr:hypothetical protein FB446DRAFT_760640 [Lentinula raphanica]
MKRVKGMNGLRYVLEIKSGSNSYRSVRPRPTRRLRNTCPMLIWHHFRLLQMVTYILCTSTIVDIGKYHSRLSVRECDLTVFQFCPSLYIASHRLDLSESCCCGTRAHQGASATRCRFFHLLDAVLGCFDLHPSSRISTAFSYQAYGLLCTLYRLILSPTQQIAGLRLVERISASPVSTSIDWVNPPLLPSILASHLVAITAHRLLPQA